MRFFKKLKKTPSAPEKVRVDEKLTHIAFIMDGNGRWAKKRGLPREYGHSEGAATLKRIVRYCGDIGIKTVTVYAFSTENWSRPKNEVDRIMSLLDAYIDEAERDLEKNALRYVFLGDKSGFSPDVASRMRHLEAVSEKFEQRLNIAVNYGGRAEIVNAARQLAKSGKEITEQSLSDAMYTAGCPDPDLIVRSANERRLSNFLLWQAAYSEYYFTETLWPDFSSEDVDAAVADFYSRGRRFGGVINK